MDDNKNVSAPHSSAKETLFYAYGPCIYEGGRSSL